MMDDSKIEQDRYERAKARVTEMREFYQHASIYLIFMVFLFIIDVITGDGWWFYWAALVWGLAVSIHAAVTFPPFGRFWDTEWEERKIAELMGEKSKRESVPEYFDTESLS